MKNKTLLYMNRLLAFIAFLIVFGRVLYDFGTDRVFEKGFRNHADYTMAYVFIVFYLALLIMSHCYVGAVFYSKKPYIIAGSISAGFITLIWAIVGLGFLIDDWTFGGTMGDIVFMHVITLLSLAMPAKSNTDPAKTPIFTPFLSNSRLKYVQYVGVRLCQKSSKMAAFWLPGSLTPMFLGKTRRASALILDV